MEVKSSLLFIANVSNKAYSYAMDAYYGKLVNYDELPHNEPLIWRMGGTFDESMANSKEYENLDKCLSCIPWLNRDAVVFKDVGGDDRNGWNRTIYILQYMDGYDSPQYAGGMICFLRDIDKTKKFVP